VLRLTVKFRLFPLVNAVVLSFVAFVALYPFLYMVNISLSDSVSVMKGEVNWWPKGVNFRMYEIVLGDPRIWTGYANSVKYTVLGTAVALFVTSFGAYALSKKKMALRKTFTLMIVFTMLFSGGMIPTFLVVKSLGMLNTIWAMVLPGAVNTWYLIIMRTFFSEFPSELEEAGKIDGLTDLGIFLRIVIPLSKAVFATIGLFYAVGIWNNFLAPLMYLRLPELFPLQVILREIVLLGKPGMNQATVGGDDLILEDSLRFATIVVSTVPILLVYPFLQKYFVQGAMIGSLKG
jgi:putative aldouronate transport system permease protein